MGEVYLIRDEPRARTARSSRHTLVTAYQFANSSISEDEFTSKATAAMDSSSGEYDWLGLEPTAKLLEVETASDYFPHFSQVTPQCDSFLHRPPAVFVLPAPVCHIYSNA